MYSTNSQAGQDIFVQTILQGKKNGFYLEIGSNDPISGNNSYALEKDHNWKGIMVEYLSLFKDIYENVRPNAIHVFENAVHVDYLKILQDNNFPNHMDYLQIDLEVDNSSTIQTLENLNNNVLDKYKFATVTFEHDIYRGDYFNTRQRSREIFQNRGYVRVFSDVKNDENPFEDWYVHPDLVNMEYVSKIISPDMMHWSVILNKLRSTEF